MLECEISKARWKKTGKDVLVKWLKGERELRETAKYSIHRDGVKHSLKINQLMFEDMAEYSAIITEDKSTAKLDITDKKIEFVSALKDIEVNEKETAQFDCEVNRVQQNKPGELLPITWYKQVKNESGEVKEEQLAQGKRLDMVRLNKKLMLKINTAELDDAGVYTVMIGDAKCSAKLTVKEIAVAFNRKLEDQTGIENHSVTFECLANRADKTAKWFMNDKEITKEQIRAGKFVPSQEKAKFQLIINNLDYIKDNNARVTCQVGGNSTSATLYVEEEGIKFVERLTDTGVKENTEAVFV